MANTKPKKASFDILFDLINVRLNGDQEDNNTTIGLSADGKTTIILMKKLCKKGEYPERDFTLMSNGLLGAGYLKVEFRENGTDITLRMEKKA